MRVPRTTRALPADHLVLDVDRLTYGFDAVARAERRVLFVPYAAPGDRVLADVVERHAGWDRVRVAAVVRAGAARTLPGCRWYPTCGGCQWQHVAPAAQRDAKAGIVRDQLARIAGLRDAVVLPTVASPADWGHRARVSLVVEGRAAGYHRARSHTLVEIGDCPIADPVLSAHLDAARAWVAALRVPLRRVTVSRAPDGVVLTGHATGRPGTPDLLASETLLATRPSVRGTVLLGAEVRQVAGDPTVAVPLEPGLVLEVPADAFTQSNPGANARLVEVVLDFAGFGRGARVLDLYCGAGNFALPLARRGVRVEGIERDPVAVAAAVANAARLGLAAGFVRGEVAATLASRAPGSADGIVLDPPRRGAAEALGALVALRAPKLVYVSCDPATLARDLRHLVAAGYRVARVQPVDLFPQTYHVETVADLRLT